MTSSKIWYANQTQVFWTCKALIEERTINHRAEICEVRGSPLDAIIYRLKTGFKRPVEVDFLGPENITYFKRTAGTDTSKLKFPRSAKALLERDAA